MLDTETHPRGRHCSNQLCCWGPDGKRPPKQKSFSCYLSFATSTYVASCTYDDCMAMSQAEAAHKAKKIWRKAFKELKGRRIVLISVKKRKLCFFSPEKGKTYAR